MRCQISSRWACESAGPTSWRPHLCRGQTTPRPWRPSTAGRPCAPGYRSRLDLLAEAFTAHCQEFRTSARRGGALCPSVQAETNRLDGSSSAPWTARGLHLHLGSRHSRCRSVLGLLFRRDPGGDLRCATRRALDGMPTRPSSRHPGAAYPSQATPSPLAVSRGSAMLRDGALARPAERLQTCISYARFWTPA